MTEKLTKLEIQMKQLERDVKELNPLLSELKPSQAREVLANILPKGACIESLQILLNQFTSM